tara:strand:+ start:176 stop:703 length:528 start_codon:yes stop_codon:yes gene_type:complete
MEQHFNPSESFTLLGSSQQLLRIEEKCSYCEDSFSNEDYCTCNPLRRYICILVRIEGSPAPTIDLCNYHIQVWNVIKNSTECEPYILWDESPIIFSIRETIHIERDFIEQIKSYKLQLDSLECSNYSFKGTTNRYSYLAHFKSLVNQIYNSKERVDDSECSHIEQRMKGHSHQVI